MNKASKYAFGGKNVFLKTVGCEMDILIQQVILEHVCSDDTEDLHRDLILSPPLSSSTVVFMLFPLAKQA